MVWRGEDYKPPDDQLILTNREFFHNADPDLVVAETQQSDQKNEEDGLG